MDEERARRLTKGRLEALGYQVLEAILGLAAIDALADHQGIDLVFTDLVMPGVMSGYKPQRVCRRLICLSYAAISDLSRPA